MQPVVTGVGLAVVGVEQPEPSGGTGEASGAPSNTEESVEANHMGAAVKVNPKKVRFSFVKSGRSQTLRPNLYGECDAQCVKQW